VVRSHNELWQHAYSANKDAGQKSPTELMKLLGTFLLQIRKSVGNKTTSLSNLEMLEWFINDIKEASEKDLARLE
jgi:hypothetical protein